MCDAEQLLSARVQQVGALEIAGPFPARTAFYYVVKDHHGNRYLKISPFEQKIINLLEEAGYIRVSELLDYCLDNGYVSDVQDFFIALFHLRRMRLVAIGEFSPEQGHQDHDNEEREKSPRHRGIRIFLRFAKGFVFTRMSWKQVDEAITHFYERVGQVLFSRLTLWAFLTLIIVGMAHLLSYISTYGFSVFYKPPLRLLAVFYFLGVITSLFHELAHALVCKHFGYKVNEAGVAIYYGVLLFYVSLTDMWLAKPRERAWAMLAGPFSTFLVGNLAAIAGSLVSGREWRELLYQLAIFSCVGAVLALNPLMEWDGYYILVDVLGIPNLRQKAFRFLYEWIRRKKTCTTQDERFMLIYALLAGLWTLMTILTGIWMWVQYVRYALGGNFAYYCVPLALLLLMVIWILIKALYIPRNQNSTEKQAVGHF